MANLPPANSPDLILTHPTEEEKKQIWSLSAKNWGSALSLEEYLEREDHLANQPQTKDGGVTHWILTTSAPPNGRPILSSCESLRRATLLALPSTQFSLKHGVTHGIGSVFCAPDCRKKGYTTIMLKLLAPRLAHHQKEVGDCLFSILYSDIGPKYYAGLGWKPFRSSHVSLPAIPAAKTNGVKGVNGVNGVNGHTETATPMEEEDFLPLIAADEARLKSEVVATAKATGRPTVAVIPDVQTIEWHHLRQTFMTSKLFSRPTPVINGAISSGSMGSRVWILFTRSFYGKLDDPKSGNKLYVLRLVVENEKDTAENAEKLKAVLKIARQEAGEWGLKSVAIWNISEVVRNLLKRGGGEWEEVDREQDSLASLMWYGEGNVDDVEWVANEKFGWC